MMIGYEVPHCHYHLVPTDSMVDLDHANAKQADMEELKKMQEKIISFLSLNS